MARVTVEDCLEHVENRFKLVLLASKRARQLSMGTEPLVEWENDKATVVALREIELGLVNEEMMEAALAQPVEEDLPFDEDDLAAALHAEISRELSQPVPEGKIASQPERQPTNPFANSLAAPELSQVPLPAAVDETPSMEELLAKELAASSEDASVSSNPFGEMAKPQKTSSTDASSDYGIPTPTSTPDPSNDGD